MSTSLRPHSRGDSSSSQVPRPTARPHSGPRVARHTACQLPMSPGLLARPLSWGAGCARDPSSCLGEPRPAVRSRTRDSSVRAGARRVGTPGCGRPPATAHVASGRSENLPGASSCFSSSSLQGVTRWSAQGSWLPVMDTGVVPSWASGAGPWELCCLWRLENMCEHFCGGQPPGQRGPRPPKCPRAGLMCLGAELIDPGAELMTQGKANCHRVGLMWLGRG